MPRIPFSACVRVRVRVLVCMCRLCVSATPFTAAFNSATIFEVLPHDAAAYSEYFQFKLAPDGQVLCDGGPAAPVYWAASCAHGAAPIALENADELLSVEAEAADAMRPHIIVHSPLRSQRFGAELVFVHLEIAGFKEFVARSGGIVDGIVSLDVRRNQLGNRVIGGSAMTVDTIIEANSTGHICRTQLLAPGCWYLLMACFSYSTIHIITIVHYHTYT
jgi:hypothetical protein